MLESTRGQRTRDGRRHLIGEYQRYQTELLTRDPGRIPHYMLFRVVARLRDQLERRLVTPRFQPEPPENPQSQPPNPSTPDPSMNPSI